MYIKQQWSDLLGTVSFVAWAFACTCYGLLFIESIPYQAAQDCMFYGRILLLISTIFIIFAHYRHYYERRVAVWIEKLRKNAKWTSGKYTGEPINCPFCNTPARLVDMSGSNPAWMFRCDNKACPSHLAYGTAQEALDGWNTRAVITNSTTVDTAGGN